MENKRLILISPWSKPLKNGKENPKNYPWWKELVKLLKIDGFYIIQIGILGEKDIGADEQRFNLSLEELEILINNCFIVLSVDSFLQHFCWYIKKRGIVIFGKSDPLIFGHESNINLLKDRKYLRKNQFWTWEEETYDPEVFVSPEDIMRAIGVLKW